MTLWMPLTDVYMVFCKSNQPICSQYTLSLLPGKIRKPYGFLIFSGVEEECTGNKWVKALYTFNVFAWLLLEFSIALDRLKSYVKKTL